MSDAPQLPISNALEEATGDSLAEVMSRDPENLSRQDRDRVVEALRAQRARLAQVEAETPAKATRAPKAAKVPLGLKSTQNIEDTGL